MANLSRHAWTEGPVVKRAVRNPVVSTADATQILITLAAHPAALSFIMGCVVACLDDEGKAALRRACRICLAELEEAAR